MPAKLIIESDIDKSRQELIFDKPSITLGRKAGNDLHFNRPEISGNHAAFLMEGGQFYVQDLGSTNGTLLNGAPVVAKEKYPLQDQDLVTIAPYRITYLASRDMSSTLLENEAMKELKQAGSGTVYEQLDKIITGTAEHNIPDEAALRSRSTGTDPDIQTTASKPVGPAPAPQPAAPAPVPAQPAAAPKPAPRPVAAASPVSQREDLVDSVLDTVKEPSSIADYIWIAIGAVILALAVGLIVLIFGF